jgi:hypothetical protein
MNSNQYLNKEQSNTAGTFNPGRLSLWIVWTTGLICFVIIWILFGRSYLQLQGTAPWLMVKGNKEKLRSIDELLLSSQEVETTDRKSFVNLALRLEWNSQAPGINEDNKRRQLYNDILKKKLQRIQKNDVTDFSVKPVPR